MLLLKVNMATAYINELLKPMDAMHPFRVKLREELAVLNGEAHTHTTFPPSHPPPLPNALKEPAAHLLVEGFP